METLRTDKSSFPITKLMRSKTHVLMFRQPAVLFAHENLQMVFRMFTLSVCDLPVMPVKWKDTSYNKRNNVGKHCHKTTQSLKRNTRKYASVQERIRHTMWASTVIKCRNWSLKRNTRKYASAQEHRPNI